MERFLDLAGTIIKITGPDADFSNENTILEDFFVEPQPWSREISCRMVEQLPKKEGICVFSGNDRRVYQNGQSFVSYIGIPGNLPENGEICIVREGKYSDVFVKREHFRYMIHDRSLCSAMEAEHLIAQNRGILLHSAQIRYGDKAIVFTAPSGTGKSTQAELWRKYRGAEIINGDRSAICITDDEVTAFGVPFCGSSNIRKRSRLPLQAIVCLEQAPETTIQQITGRKAFRLLWEGCSFHTWNKEDVEKSADTVAEIIQRVPVYNLACRPDESAVKALAQLLR